MGSLNVAIAGVITFNEEAQTAWPLTDNATDVPDDSFKLFIDCSGSMQPHQDLLKQILGFVKAISNLKGTNLMLPTLQGRTAIVDALENNAKSGDKIIIISDGRDNSSKHASLTPELTRSAFAREHIQDSQSMTTLDFKRLFNDARNKAITDRAANVMEYVEKNGFYLHLIGIGENDEVKHMLKAFANAPYATVASLQPSTDDTVQMHNVISVVRESLRSQPKRGHVIRASNAGRESGDETLCAEIKKETLRITTGTTRTARTTRTNQVLDGPQFTMQLQDEYVRQVVDHFVNEPVKSRGKNVSDGDMSRFGSDAAEVADLAMHTLRLFIWITHTSNAPVASRILTGRQFPFNASGWRGGLIAPPCNTTSPDTSHSRRWPSSRWSGLFVTIMRYLTRNPVETINFSSEIKQAIQQNLVGPIFQRVENTSWPSKMCFDASSDIRTTPLAGTLLQYTFEKKQHPELDEHVLLNDRYAPPSHAPSFHYPLVNRGTCAIVPTSPDDLTESAPALVVNSCTKRQKNAYTQTH